MKSFRWHNFLILQIITGRWSCCNMLTWNASINFIHICKKFHLTIFWQNFIISTHSFSTTCKHYYKIISQRNEKSVAYTIFEMPDVHDKLTGLRRMSVGKGCLVCIINFLIAPVGNIWWGFNSCNFLSKEKVNWFLELNSVM